MSDIFAYTNEEELTSVFAMRDVEALESEPGRLGHEETLPELPRDDIPEQPSIGADRTPRNLSLFEKMFGYNPDDDMPWGYGRMSEFERAVYRANLAMQNVMTRTGLGVAFQTKGTLQLVLPESMEQYLPTATRKNEFRLKEDQFYEKRIQAELNRKQKTSEGLTPEEQEQLEYLNETLPSTFQRGPEFVGRVGAEIERIAIASTLFNMVKVPGGGTLNGHLSESGRRLLGRRILAKSAELAGKGNKVSSMMLRGLAEQIQQLGPNAGQLFTWGVLAAEKPEDGEVERLGATRVKEGVKMTAWAALPLLLVPGAKGVAATKAGTVTIEF